MARGGETHAQPRFIVQAAGRAGPGGGVDRTLANRDDNFPDATAEDAEGSLGRWWGGAAAWGTGAYRHAGEPGGPWAGGVLQPRTQRLAPGSLPRQLPRVGRRGVALHRTRLVGPGADCLAVAGSVTRPGLAEGRPITDNLSGGRSGLVPLCPDCDRHKHEGRCVRSPNTTIVSLERFLV